jgi:uncharacterized lipoprotein YajG
MLLYEVVSAVAKFPADSMKLHIIKCSLRLAVAVMMAALCGCATNSSTPQSPNAQMSAVQSGTGPTVSGYMDVGGAKTFH